MEFYEEDLFFTIENEQEKGIFDNDLPDSIEEPELCGIKIRLGNQPIVYNLRKLLELSNKKLSPELKIQFEKNNIYLITHAIGVIRLKGSAKVLELQYNSEVINEKTAKTIDLLPKTTFVDVIKSEIGLTGAIKAGGNFSAEVPDELKAALSGTSMSLGGDLEIELSTNAKFVGKINYSVKIPIVQSTGVSSNKCAWVLNSDAIPLLGDQLMVQTIAVPKELTNLILTIKASVKVRKTIFNFVKTIDTKTQTININLD